MAHASCSCFASQLSGEGMIAREGSIVDASFVDAPRARNTREQNAQIKSGERPEGFEADTQPRAGRKIAMHEDEEKHRNAFALLFNHAKNAKSKLGREL